MAGWWAHTVDKEAADLRMAELRQKIEESKRKKRELHDAKVSEAKRKKTAAKNVAGPAKGTDWQPDSGERGWIPHFKSARQRLRDYKNTEFHRTCGRYAHERYVSRAQLENEKRQKGWLARLAGEGHLRWVTTAWQ